MSRLPPSDSTRRRSRQAAAAPDAAAAQVIHSGRARPAGIAGPGAIVAVISEQGGNHVDDIDQRAGAAGPGRGRPAGNAGLRLACVRVHAGGGGGARGSRDAAVPGVRAGGDGGGERPGRCAARPVAALATARHPARRGTGRRPGEPAGPAARALASLCQALISRLEDGRRIGGEFQVTGTPAATRPAAPARSVTCWPGPGMTSQATFGDFLDDARRQVAAAGRAPAGGEDLRDTTQSIRRVVVVLGRYARDIAAAPGTGPGQRRDPSRRGSRQPPPRTAS